jgi:predicted membrane protein
MPLKYFFKKISSGKLFILQHLFFELIQIPFLFSLILNLFTYFHQHFLKSGPGYWL